LLVIQLTYKDIWLDFFYSRQKEIVKLKSGDHLAVNEEGCLDRNGYYVIRFSKAFKEKVADYKNRGFQLVRSRINLIIHWKKQDTENEIKILLPEVKLSRR
jgi:ATP-dependent DNA helicase RecQ